MANGRVGIRKVDGLTIIFYDARTVYVKPDNAYFWTVFQRWFHRERGFCTNKWKPWTKHLRHNRHVSLQVITSQAIERGITVSGGSAPNLEGREVYEIPSWGRERNKPKEESR